MPHRLLDAIVYVEQAPLFHIKDGLVHISQQMGAVHFERVMLLSTFKRTIACAQQAISDYAAHGTAEVIPVEFNSKFERVFPADKEAG